MIRRFLVFLVSMTCVISGSGYADLPEDFEYIEAPDERLTIYRMHEYLQTLFPDLIQEGNRFYDLRDRVDAQLYEEGALVIPSFTSGQNTLLFAEIVEHQRYEYTVPDPEIAALLAPSLPWNAVFYLPTHGTGDVWSDAFIDKGFDGEHRALINTTNELIHFDPHEAIHLWQLQEQTDEESTYEHIRFYEFQALAGDLALSPYVSHDDSVENIQRATRLTNRNHGQYPAGRFIVEYFQEHDIDIDALEELTPDERRAHGIELLMRGNPIGTGFNHLYKRTD